MARTLTASGAFPRNQPVRHAAAGRAGAAGRRRHRARGGERPAHAPAFPDAPERFAGAVVRGCSP